MYFVLLFRVAFDGKCQKICCAAEQNTVLLFAIPKVVAARRNKKQCFCSQFKSFSLCGRTKCRKVELFLLANSKTFHCAVEQNTVAEQQRV
jgi:hypothetical protein